MKNNGLQRPPSIIFFIRNNMKKLVFIEYPLIIQNMEAISENYKKRNDDIVGHKANGGDPFRF